MTTRYWTLGATVVALVALLVAACGDDNDMAGHDMGGGTMMTGTMPAGSAMMTPSAGMDHMMSGTPMSAEEMDLGFIDSMIPHHQSAIDMAEVALEQAEHEEIKELAQAIIDAQQAEIDQLEQWRDQWFPGAPVSSGMPGMENMTGMSMSDSDMQMLRDADPFDKAFIDMMIPHHESAIAMAHAIQETTQRPELQELADAIITAQESEIAQMRAWRAEWYGQ